MNRSLFFSAYLQYHVPFSYLSFFFFILTSRFLCIKTHSDNTAMFFLLGFSHVSHSIPTWSLYRKFLLKFIAGKITSPLQRSWNELFTVLYYLTRHALLKIKASSHKTESLMTYFLYSFKQPGCPALGDSLKNYCLEFIRGTQN